MNGFEAISTHNGWVMAGTGAIIVFLGLAALSFSISLLPKLLALLDRRKAADGAGESVPGGTAPVPDHSLSDIGGAARLYEPLIAELGEPFQLVELYKLTRSRDLPHPHLTISCLRQANFLVPAGDGAFTWNKEQLNS